MIPFQVPTFTGKEPAYIMNAICSGKIGGDGEYSKLCAAWIEQETGTKKAFLTTSGTHALEMSALLCGIQPGDEVIMPSYTFSSTANAFVLRGAKLVFVDIRPDTMNIDESLIEGAITERTKVIVPVHYGGVGCEMDTIMEIAEKYRLLVVEDAAQAVCAFYKGRALGTIGDFGCYSFHETKNFSMGEGGAILVNHAEDIERVEILREKGTDRSQFLRGQIDRYSWRSVGSSYLPSDLNAAYLWAQFEMADKINQDRKKSWSMYYKKLKDLEDTGQIELAHIPESCGYNAHTFYIKTADINERTRFISYMKECGIMTAFHFVPLHSTPAGRIYGRFYGNDIYTTRESERLVRLPLYYRLSEDTISYISEKIHMFYQNLSGK